MQAIFIRMVRTFRIPHNRTLVDARFDVLKLAIRSHRQLFDVRSVRICVSDTAVGRLIAPRSFVRTILAHRHLERIKRLSVADERLLVIRAWIRIGILLAFAASRLRQRQLLQSVKGLGQIFNEIGCHFLPFQKTDDQPIGNGRFYRTHAIRIVVHVIFDDVPCADDARKHENEIFHRPRNAL